MNNTIYRTYKQYYNNSDNKEKVFTEVLRKYVDLVEVHELLENRFTVLEEGYECLSDYASALECYVDDDEAKALWGETHDDKY